MRRTTITYPLLILAALAILVVLAPGIETDVRGRPVDAGERITATNNGFRWVHPEYVANFDAPVLTQNQVLLERFWVGHRTRVSKLTFRVSVADAADPNFQAGIYNDACDTLLGSIPVQGNTVTDTVATYTVNMTTPFTLEPGYYWFGYTTNSAGVLAVRRSNPNSDINMINNSGFNNKSSGTASTGGALNSTCGSRSAQNFTSLFVGVLE